MSAVRIYALPALCAALMLAGLVLSLVEDGPADLFGGAAVTLPLLLAASRAMRNRKLGVES